jgi:ribulose bisphosphate carboxylase small subunit
MYVYMVEIEEAKKAHSEAHIRVMALDSVRQVQVARFISQRPRSLMCRNLGVMVAGGR